MIPVGADGWTVDLAPGAALVEHAPPLPSPRSMPLPGRLVRSAFAAALACVAGCASVRDARLAEDPGSAVPGERTPTAKELGLPTAGPLKLADALGAALRAHPSVVQARRSEEEAEARVGSA